MDLLFLSAKRSKFFQLNGIVLVSLLLISSVRVHAEENAPKQEIPTSPGVTPESTPAIYVLPFQLRPVIPSNSVRLDSSTGLYHDSAGRSDGLATSSVATGSYKFLPNAAGIVKLGFVSNNPPASGPSAVAFLNPLVTGTYAVPVADGFKSNFIFGFSVPVGSGGNTASAATRAATSTGMLVRSAMDNAMFAVNYFTLIPGADLAYVGNGFTAQIEATVLFAYRVRGELVDSDASRVNLTSGFALGYAITPSILIESELRYQRWLSNGAVYATAKPACENMTLGIGPRFLFKTGSLSWKPGIAYIQGLMGTLASADYSSATNRYQTLFLDVPVSF